MTLFIFTMTARIYIGAQASWNIGPLSPSFPPLTPLIPLRWSWASQGVMSICQESQQQSFMRIPKHHHHSLLLFINITSLWKSSCSKWIPPLRVVSSINHVSVLFLVAGDGCGLDAALRLSKQRADIFYSSPSHWLTSKILPSDWLKYHSFLETLVPRATQKEK